MILIQKIECTIKKPKIRNRDKNPGQKSGQDLKNVPNSRTQKCHFLLYVSTAADHFRIHVMYTEDSRDVIVESSYTMYTTNHKLHNMHSLTRGHLAADTLVIFTCLINWSLRIDLILPDSSPANCILLTVLVAIALLK